MALVGLNTSATLEYQSVNDPQYGEEGATTFHLGYLDSFIMARVRDKMMTVVPQITDGNVTGVAETHTNIAAIEACRFGIKGWENFVDINDKPIEYRTEATFISGRKYEAVPPDLLAQIPFDDLKKMSEMIMDVNTPKKTEVKNSVGAS